MKAALDPTDLGADAPGLGRVARPLVSALIHLASGLTRIAAGVARSSAARAASAARRPPPQRRHATRAEALAIGLGCDAMAPRRRHSSRDTSRRTTSRPVDVGNSIRERRQA